MLSIIKNLFSFISPNKWVIFIILGLSASTAIAGKLLLNAHEDLGKAQYSAIQWKKANELLTKAYQDLDAKLVAREQQRYALQHQLNQLNKKLSEVKDETNCLDADMPDDLKLLINSTDDVS